ncbi:MAG: methionyl-tRNA formyltransferase [Ruminococcaceae bacterium]|nr:methionyl-tRNA formyltransferase [Oscillospiraceae bacterium]
MRILFMGTPDFAVPTLRALMESGEEVIGVVTQPDKPKGRSYVLTPPPVKVFATEKRLPVYQPKTLRDEAFASLLEELAPDMIVVVAFGKILPKNVLDYPKYGCINVHGSLLPAYRGAAPMQRAIIEGEKVTGITTMYMDVGLDTGDMLLKAEYVIGEDDNFETVHDALSELGAKTLIETVEQIKNGTAVRIKQDDALATHAAKIEKEDCLLDFSMDATALHNLIRGLSPIPLAFTHTPDGKLLKVTASRVISTEETHSDFGKVLSLDGEIAIACGKGILALTAVLPEGKGKMNAADFIRGRKIAIGDTLQ